MMAQQQEAIESNAEDLKQATEGLGALSTRLASLQKDDTNLRAELDQLAWDDLTDRRTELVISPVFTFSVFHIESGNLEVSGGGNAVGCDSVPPCVTTKTGARKDSLQGDHPIHHSGEGKV